MNGTSIYVTPVCFPRTIQETLECLQHQQIIVSPRVDDT